jgi:hypothetical protein
MESGESGDLMILVGFLRENVAYPSFFCKTIQSSIRISSTILIGINEKTLFQTTPVVKIDTPRWQISS